MSSTNWGLSETAILELGYGLTDMIVLGGFAQIGGESTTTELESGTESEESSFSLFLGPKLDFMFSPGQRVQPYVGAAVAYTTSSAEAGVNETSLSGFQLLGRAGVRAFLADGFSLDPALLFGWTSMSGDVDFGAVEADVDGSAFNIGVMVGFSGWL